MPCYFHSSLLKTNTDAKQENFSASTECAVCKESVSAINSGTVQSASKNLEMLMSRMAK